MKNKINKNKLIQIKNTCAFSKNYGALSLCFLLFFVALGAIFSPEVFAVKDGEMKTGVTYLTGLLDNNIIPLVLLTGIGAGAGMAYMKSSFSPLVISICTAGGYGFAHKWISSVYTICI